MQFISELLSALTRQGVTVSLVGGKLKVEPRLLITDEVKKDILQHKAEIVAALTGWAAKDSTYAPEGGGQVEPEIRPPVTDVESRLDAVGSRNTTPSTPDSQGCFECGHYDGKGVGWPGMCRYFETKGEPAKEIDFDVVDPLTGCKWFLARSVGVNMEIPCLMQGGSETLPPLKLVQAKDNPKSDSPQCLICGLPLNQDGMDCWHKAFHLGEVFPLKGVNLKPPPDLRAPSELTPSGGNLYASDAFQGSWIR